MRPSWPRRLPPPVPRTDSGFTLVELIVTMLVIAGALLALFPLQVKAQQTVALGRERQQATALANQAIERVRGRAAEPEGAVQIVKGRMPTTGDPNILGTCPACTFRPSFETSRPVETLRTSGAESVLSDNVKLWNSTTFTTRLYVTTPSTAAANSAHVTAVTSWTSRQAANRPSQVAIRTTVFHPTSP